MAQKCYTLWFESQWLKTPCLNVLESNCREPRTSRISRNYQVSRSLLSEEEETINWKVLELKETRWVLDIDIPDLDNRIFKSPPSPPKKILTLHWEHIVIMKDSLSFFFCVNGSRSAGSVRSQDSLLLRSWDPAAFGRVTHDVPVFAELEFGLIGIPLTLNFLLQCANALWWEKEPV